jgi:hypothetical protein
MNASARVSSLTGAQLDAAEAEQWLVRRVTALLQRLQSWEAVLFLTRLRTLRGILEALRFWDMQYGRGSHKCANASEFEIALWLGDADWKLIGDLCHLAGICDEEVLRDAVSGLVHRGWSELEAVLRAANDVS